MVIAQQLYEGIDLGAEGATGLITYMRTDSTRVSADAMVEVAELHPAFLRRRLSAGGAARLSVARDVAGRPRSDPADGGLAHRRPR